MLFSALAWQCIQYTHLIFLSLLFCILAREILALCNQNTFLFSCKSECFTRVLCWSFSRGGLRIYTAFHRSAIWGVHCLLVCVGERWLLNHVEHTPLAQKVFEGTHCMLIIIKLLTSGSVDFVHETEAPFTLCSAARDLEVKRSGFILYEWF